MKLSKLNLLFQKVSRVSLNKILDETNLKSTLSAKKLYLKSLVTSGMDSFITSMSSIHFSSTKASKWILSPELTTSFNSLETSIKNQVIKLSLAGMKKSNIMSDNNRKCLLDKFESNSLIGDGCTLFCDDFETLVLRGNWNLTEI